MSLLSQAQPQSVRTLVARCCATAAASLSQSWTLGSTASRPRPSGTSATDTSMTSALLSLALVSRECLYSCWPPYSSVYQQHPRLTRALGTIFFFFFFFTGGGGGGGGLAEKQKKRVLTSEWECCSWTDNKKRKNSPFLQAGVLQGYWSSADKQNNTAFSAHFYLFLGGS